MKDDRPPGWTLRDHSDAVRLRTCTGSIRRRQVLAAVAAAAAAAVAGLCGGCGSPLGSGCGGNVAPGVVVWVRDARTAAPAADGATGTLSDNAYAETLQPGIVTQLPGQPPVTVALHGAIGRPGTYTVHIEKPGYQPWQVQGVRVRQGPCTVDTVRLDADLQPTP